jgi:hypothetical protein
MITAAGTKELLIMSIPELSDLVWGYIRTHDDVTVAMLCRDLKTRRNRMYLAIAALVQEGRAQKVYDAPNKSGRQEYRVRPTHVCTSAPYIRGCLKCRNIEKRRRWKEARLWYSAPADKERASKNSARRRA